MERPAETNCWPESFAATCQVWEGALDDDDDDDDDCWPESFAATSGCSTVSDRKACSADPSVVCPTELCNGSARSTG